MTLIPNWRYTKQFSITGSGYAGTNYQLRIVVHYGSGTDSGSDVYLNGKCRSDFGDIRFTDANENLLNYWLETYVASNYAIFWVKITDDLSSGNTANAVIWYGNPEATTISNGASTFIFFDDFTNDRSSNGSWSNLVTESFGGKYVLAQMNDNSNAVVTLQSAISDLGIEFRYYIVSKGTYGPRAGIQFIENGSNRFYELSNEIESYNSNYYHIRYFNGSTYSTIVYDGNSYSFGTWYRNYFYRYSTSGNLKGQLGASSTLSVTNSTLTSFNRIGFCSWSSGNKFYIDWVAVRKFTINEPYISAWSEESAVTIRKGLKFFYDVSRVKTHISTEYSIPIGKVFKSITEKHLFRKVIRGLTLVNNVETWDSFSYKKYHIVESNYNGYQIKINVYYGSGSSFGDSVYLDGNCKSDFSDIRFSDENGNNYPYWIESYTAGVSATVWVKINVKSPWTYFIMYYGNPNANSHSDGKSTFEFFDDFTTYTVNTDINGQGGWITKRIGGTGEAKIRAYNSKNHLRITSTNSATTVVRPLSVSNSGYAIRIREVATDWDECLLSGFSDGGVQSDGHPVNSYDFAWWGWAGAYSKIRKFVSNTGYDLSSISDSASNGVYYILEGRWVGTSLSAYRNDTLKMIATDSTFSSFSYLYLGEWSGSDRYIDWVCVRKLLPVEPIQQSWRDNLPIRSTITLKEIIKNLGRRTISVRSYRIGVVRKLFTSKKNVRNLRNRVFRSVHEQSFKRRAISLKWFNSLDELFQFSKRHYIYPNSGTINNGIVRILLKYGEGGDHRESAFLMGRSQSDFSDVRYYQDGKKLSYYTIEKVNGNYCLDYVKVPEISSSSYIDVKFGVSGMSSESSYSNVKSLIDDFNDGSLNTGIWYSLGSGTITESSGIVEIIADASSAKAIRTIQGYQLNPQVIIETEFRYFQSTSEGWIIIGTVGYENESTVRKQSFGGFSRSIRVGYANGTFYVQYLIDETITTLYSVSRTPPSSLTKYVITLNRNTITVQEGSTILGTWTHNFYGSDSKIKIGYCGYNTGKIQADNLYVFALCDAVHGEWVEEIPYYPLYKKKHCVMKTEKAGTNYSSWIDAYYSSGVDNGSTVYLNGKCRSDFKDVRIKTLNGSLVPSWRETVNIGNYAKIWFKVPVDLSTMNFNFYITYGDTDSTILPQEKPREVFPIWEDFESIPDGEVRYDATLLLSSGILRCTDTRQGISGIIAYNTIPSTVGIITTFKFRAYGSTNYPADAVWFGMFDSTISGTVDPNYPREDVCKGGYHFTYDEYYGNPIGGARIAFTKSTIDNGPPIAYSAFTQLNSTIWQNAKIEWRIENNRFYTKMYWNGTLKLDAYDAIIQPNATLGVGWTYWGGATGHGTNYHELDDIILRKYVYPEPQHTINWVEYSPLQLKSQYGIYPRNIRVTK